MGKFIVESKGFVLFCFNYRVNDRKKSTKPQKLLKQITHCDFCKLKGNEPDAHFLYCTWCTPGFVSCA